MADYPRGDDLFAVDPDVGVPVGPDPGPGPEGLLKNCTGPRGAPGAAGSLMTAERVNPTIEEIVNFIRDSGLTPSYTDWHQMPEAARRNTLNGLLSGYFDSAILAVFNNIFSDLATTPLVVRPSPGPDEFPTINAALATLERVPFPIGSRATIDIAGAFPAHPACIVTVPVSITASAATTIAFGSGGISFRGPNSEIVGCDISVTGGGACLTAEGAGNIEAIGCSISSIGATTAVNAGSGGRIRLTNCDIVSDARGVWAQNGGSIELRRNSPGTLSIDSAEAMLAREGGRITTAAAAGTETLSINLIGSAAVNAERGGQIYANAADNVTWSGLTPVPTMGDPVSYILV